MKKLYSDRTPETNESGLSKCSKAQCQQIGTISKIRITGKKVGMVNEKILLKINAALRLHLEC